MSNTPAQKLILAVLAAAREAGAKQLTLTGLVKFVYLADLLFAEEQGGRTCSGLRWRLMHYGPYAGEIEDELGALQRARTLERVEQHGREHDYQLLSLQEFARPPTLEQLGLSAEGRLIFKGWVTRFGGDLSSLLNYVYKNTEPMMGARAGEELRMERSVRVDYKRDVRPIPIPVRDPKKVMRARELMQHFASRGAEARSGSLLPGIKHDAVFWSEVPDDPEYPAVGEFTADITRMRG